MARHKRDNDRVHATRKVYLGEIRRILEPPTKNYYGTPVLEGPGVRDVPISRFSPGARWFGVDGEEYFYPEEVLDYTDEDFAEMQELVEERAAVSDLSSPLYTLKELGNLTERFLAHLERNRESLVATGHPQTNFERSRWLDSWLTRLYYIKLPIKVTGERDRREDFVYTYTWPDKTVDGLSLPPPPPGVPLDQRHERYWWTASSDTTTDDRLPASSCAYEDAALIQGLDPIDAARLGVRRAKFFDLKIAILQTLLQAVRSAGAGSLWARCLRLLTDALTAEEVSFYYRMDQFYVGFDLDTHSTVERETRLLSGGLTDLLAVVGHYEKELTIKTLARTRENLGDLVKKDWLGRPFLKGGYYSRQANPQDLAILNSALEQYRALEVQEQAFWRDYCQRVNEAFKTEFRVAIEVPQRFERYLRGIYEFAKGQFDTIGSLPPLGLSHPTPPPELSTSSGSHLQHSPDFRSVSVSGQPYTFTGKQAQVVEILWEAYQSATPELGQAYILETLESTSGRLRDLFKSSDAWGTLIVPGSKRGTFRLNI